MKKSWWLSVCALLVIVAMVMPAAQAADPEFDWKQEEGKTINLILVRHAYSDSTVPLLPEFEELTGITVEYDILSEEEYREKLLIDLSTGAGTYDIFMTGPVSNWQYAPAGWMEPLDDYINDPSLTSPDWDFEDFWPSLIAASRWNLEPGSGVGEGPLWALPVNEEGYALFYRKDLFEEKGIDVPETYEELYETAKALNGTEWDGKKLSGFVARGNRSWPTIHTGYGSLFWTWGGEDFDENFKCVIDSPEGVAATELWGKIMSETAPADVVDYTWYDAQEAFAAGKAAMFIDADHMSEAFENPEKSQVAGKVGYAVPPKGPNGEDPKTNLWVWSIAMTSASKEKNAAWLWLQWASSKDILTRSAVKGNINPCRISVAEAPEVMEYMEDWGDYQETYIYLLDEVVGLRWAPLQEQSEVGDLWAVAVQEVILGAKDAQQALDDAAAVIDKTIEAAGYTEAE